uniref:Uncharacterized protein n=1 Tax=Canis lupus familiaris TaxID=9615 RepID=A0A8C0MPD7_CANLF
MMKLRIPTGCMPNPTNSNRTIPSHTLHIRHSNSLFISHPYLPRRKLRLNYPIYTCKWSLHIFHLSIYTQRMGIILRLLLFDIPTYVVH